jgi:hypothetical protein
MRTLLAPGGVIVLDVQNRWCAAAYGWLPTLARIVRDVARPSERSGDVTFSWRAGGATIPATGHVFTPREVPRLARAVGLHVRGGHVIDPATGVPRRHVFAGHLVYVLEPRGSVG